MLKMEEEKLNLQMKIQEQTLKHVASEIHDNFTPVLSVINLNLAGIIDSFSEHSIESIRETKIIVKQLMGEMKTLSITLNTDHIEKTGLFVSMEEYVGMLERSGVYKISCDRSGNFYRLSADIEINLFRMCQETLNNIIKHADAKCIEIDFVYNPDFFSILISDDGKGFDLNTVMNMPGKNKSTGLQNLYARAKMINAELKIKSSPKSGTSVGILIKL